MNTQVKFLATLFSAAALFFTAQTASAQSVSDAELKKNQTPIKNSLSYIEQLKPLTFEFNKDKFKQLNLPAGTQYGFSTDEVQRILPGLVTKQYKWYVAGKNNQRAVATNAVDYDKLIPLLVGAIKEQQAEIEQLRASVQQLKAK
ncbi:tail fiber domain-containing protein [Mucilaginibacter hurinus]|uniref:Tail fiber domain-containing protein n=1 Tax=Mucilaginibacter hurinus TaxID=2201324 RepID=A0A367GRB5_9SPHI|nr:tail fiber domain-containing protein [Mucilaginibacter hurinus]RCH55625.1 tail fiber domain-containing protein [Mucilaginibacter hurinus]